MASNSNVPPKYYQFYAPYLKRQYELRRYPFLVLSFLAMAYTLVSTIFFPLEYRLGGLAIFSLLVILAYLLFNGHRSQYEKWKPLNLDRLYEVAEFDLAMEKEFHKTFKDSESVTWNKMAEAADRQDIRAMEEYAHTLKGACLSIGYDDLAATCLRIENWCKKNNLERACALIPKSRNQLEAINRLMHEYFKLREQIDSGETKKTK